MKFLDCETHKVVIFETVDDAVKNLPVQYNESELVYVALNGTDTDLLSSERFLVKNYNSSFYNHMQWEGLLDDEEQEDYILKCARKFYETGKQMVIEDYDFQQDEPFYDYSK